MEAFSGAIYYNGYKNSICKNFAVKQNLDQHIKTRKHKEA